MTRSAARCHPRFVTIAYRGSRRAIQLMATRQLHSRNSITRQYRSQHRLDSACSPQPVSPGSKRLFLRIAIRRNWCARPCRTKSRRPMTTPPTFCFAAPRPRRKGSTTRLYVETREATAGLVIAYNGKPLTPEQRQDGRGARRTFHPPSRRTEKKARTGARQRRTHHAHHARIARRLPV